MTEKQIRIEIYNSFTGETYLGLTTRYNRSDALNNWYLRWVRKMKLAEANIWGIDEILVKAKFSIS